MQRAARERTGGCGGFSLVELLLVVIIVAVLAVVLAPRIREASRFRLAGATRKVVEDVRFARQKAMDTRVIYGVEFQTAADRYLVYSSAAGVKTTAVDPHTRGAFQVDLNTGEFSGITLDAASFSGDAFVEFDGIGTPSNGGAVVLGGGGATAAVSVAADTGMVSYP